MERKLRVLVVDDIFANRLLLSEVLKDLGHDYVEVENGKEAIDALQKDSFDLVLMDIEMPVMNGLETTRYIRQGTDISIRDVPIIALTAHNPSLFFDDFKDIGFTNLLTKPYSVDKIKSVISEAFNS